MLQELKEDNAILLWHKNDYEVFIEYYKFIFPEFAQSTAMNYNDLSYRQEFFLILKDMDKSDPQIKAILSVTQNAIDVTNYRIKKHQSH